VCVGVCQCLRVPACTCLHLCRSVCGPLYLSLFLSFFLSFFLSVGRTVCMYVCPNACVYGVDGVGQLRQRSLATAMTRTRRRPLSARPQRPQPRPLPKRQVLTTMTTMAARLCLRLRLQRLRVTAARRSLWAASTSWEQQQHRPPRVCALHNTCTCVCISVCAYVRACVCACLCLCVFDNERLCMHNSMMGLTRIPPPPPPT
jgi:hypothetical protein